MDPCVGRTLGDGTFVLTVTELDDDAAAEVLRAHADVVARAPRLVMDLRTCAGGAEVVGRTADGYIHRYTADNGQEIYFASHCLSILKP